MLLESDQTITKTDKQCSEIQHRVSGMCNQIMQKKGKLVAIRKSQSFLKNNWNFSALNSDKRTFWKQPTCIISVIAER